MSARKWSLRLAAGLIVAFVPARFACAQLPILTTKPAAVVDGVAITQAEVDAILKQAGPSATPLTEVQRRQMRMEAVGMLIDDLLMQQFLRKNGPRIDPSEVNKRVIELRDSLKAQGKTVEDFYKESGQSEAQLRSNIVNMLQWGAYVKDHLNEADIKRYYEENRDFFDRVGVRASHIVLRVAPTASPGEREAVRAKLQAIRQDILSAKTDFAEAAKKYSQCTSAPAGGDIGYFPRKLAVEESFAKAAFSLKVGEMSDIVQTDYGVHLIKVTDRKAGQPSDFNKIKDEVRELCIEEMRLALLAEQRKAAHIEINMP